jgi:hypothetical protein
MSQLDDILARSRGPGAFVERSRFTLARDKAVEKMREYALRDPRRYILEIIQGAVFSGARFLAIDVCEQHVSIAWVGGRAYQVHELENLLDYLLSRRRGADHRHVVQLAVAVNALLQRKPKLIRIESGDGTREGTVLIEMDKDGNGVRGEPQEGLAGTYLYAEFEQSWSDRFSTSDLTDEQQLIETHCQYSSVPILLNGRAPFGWRGGRPTMDGANFDDGQRWGTVYRAHPSDQRFRVVIGGVVVSEQVLPELGALRDRQSEKDQLLLRGVICDDNLRRTADHSDIVRDRAFHEMLHALQPHCTNYIRDRRSNYTPPPLEPLPEIVAERSEQQTPQVAPEPLPALIRQLGLRSAAPCQVFDEKVDDPRSPAFWVRPRDVDRMTEAANVTRLPYPVYVMTPGQVRTLESEYSGAAVIALGRPADVDFIVRSLERFALRPTIEVRLEHDGFSGNLRIRATLNGPRIGWDPAADPAEVPLLISLSGRALFVRTLSDLPIPGLDVVWDLDEGSVAPEEEIPFLRMIDIVQRTVRAEIWRLFQQMTTSRADPRIESARRDLVAGALSVVAQPYFVRTDGVVKLLAHLPAELEPVESQLLGTPLVDTDTGTLSFDAFIALQGTSRAVQLKTDADLARMVHLEDRFGYGNLSAPGASGRVLTVFAFPSRTEQDASRWMLTAHGRPDEAVAQIWVERCLATPETPKGTELVDTGLVGVFVAKRAHSGVMVDIRTGLDLLFEQMVEIRNGRADASLLASLDARDHAMIRLAVASLVDSDPKWRNIPLFEVGAERWSLGRVRDRPDFGVVPQGGVASASDPVVALTLDEVRAIERAQGEQLPLRFDDPPSVWIEAEQGDWLLRVPIRYGRVRGWMGLRSPFDGTGGVLFKRGEGMSATAPTVRQVPSHGMVWSSDPNDSAHTIPDHMIDLANRKLYQALGGKLAGGRWSGADLETATSYAQVWVLEESRRGAGQLSAVGELLAQHAVVEKADGQVWGTLRQWLRHPEVDRPKLALYFPEIATIRPRAMPDLSLDLAPWITELVRMVTGVDNLTVTITRVGYTDAETLRPTPKVRRSSAMSHIWRRRHFEIRNDVIRWATEGDSMLETRWMLTAIILRQWFPDVMQIQQDMLSRLMASSLD